MTPTADIPLKEPVISAAASDAEQLERARIDASTRVPVLIFYASAMVWLLVGTLLAGFVSFKLHQPDWLSDVSYLTWGRLRPVHMNVMVYGWASMAAMGTAIWLMARLCRTTLRHPLLIVTGIWFWNIGVLIGVIGILMGYSTGYQWLEFPPYAAVVLFIAYALIVSWAVLMFRFRRGDQIYITQWYLLGAFLWFPWLYAAAQAMLFVVPVQGYFPVMRYSPTLRFTVFGAMSYTVFSVVGIFISLRSTARYLHFSQASIAYSHLGLYAFFTMTMFGSMYYIVPRLVGREWRYATLIKLHFWSSAYGVGLMSLMLLVGGFVEGANQNDPSLPFIQSAASVLPYLRGRTLAALLLTISHFIFAFHFGLMLFGLGRTSTVPTFLNPVEAEGSEPQL